MATASRGLYGAPQHQHHQQQQQHHDDSDCAVTEPTGGLDPITMAARLCPIKTREKYFRHHASGVVRLNHGSFGACPQPVMDATAEARAAWYQQPDVVYLEQLEPQMLESRKAVSEIVNCDVRDIALVDNASTGALVVAHLVAKDLQRRLLQDPVGYVRPRILVPNFVYGAVKNLFIEHLADLADIEYIDFPFPMESRSQALEALYRALTCPPPTTTTTTATMMRSEDERRDPSSMNDEEWSHPSSCESFQQPSPHFTPDLVSPSLHPSASPSPLSSNSPSSPFNLFQSNSSGHSESPFGSNDGFAVPSPNLFDRPPPSPSFFTSPSPSIFPFSPSPSPFQQQQQQQLYHSHDQQNHIATTTAATTMIKKQQQQQQRGIRLVLLDHISSVPSVVFPIEEMVKMCYNCGAEEVFIDGAHSIGQTHIDLMAIGADYYTSNLHKWLFCATSVAFFFCHPRKRGNQMPPLMSTEMGTDQLDFRVGNNFGQPHHPLTSHNYHRGMGAEFAWTGTRDYCSFLSVPVAINFVNSILGGVDNLISYNHYVVLSAAEMISKAWGTSIGTREEELVGSMINIRLPDALCAQIHSPGDALKLRSLIRDYFRVECVPFYWRENESYVRLSAQIYNSWNDFEVLRDSVLASIKMFASMNQ